MFAIRTIADLNNLIELQSAVLNHAIGESSEIRFGSYSMNLDLFKHKWTMIKVPVEISGYQKSEEENMRIHFVRHYLKNSDAFLKSIVSPHKISMKGKWIPFYVVGEYSFGDSIRLTHDNENILSGVSPEARAFLERSILPHLGTEWMLEDIVSAIVWAKVRYNMKPEVFNVDVFSAHHSLMYYVRKVLWSLATPKFKKAYA